MPRVSLSTDYLLGNSYHTFDSLIHCDRGYSQISSFTPKLLNTNQQQTILSPDDINQILSRKLYEQLKTNSTSEISKQNSSINASIDPELIILVDRFFNLTYLNTIPMVNLLATAVATNFLKENIRELDNKLKEQQALNTYMNIKRGTSLFNQSENDEDDNLSWTSAPT